MTKTDEIDGSSAPLIEHLIELRTRIIWSLLAFVIAMILSFLFWNPIFDFLTRPLCISMAARGQGNCGLILVALQEGFTVAVSISMMGGLILAFPVISYQLWRFVAPGLYKKEKNAFLPFLIASPAMFFLGAAFAYYIITPMAFSFFLGFQQPGTLVTGPDAGSNVARAGKDAQIRHRRNPDRRGRCDTAGCDVTGDPVCGDLSAIRSVDLPCPPGREKARG